MKTKTNHNICNSILSIWMVDYNLYTEAEYTARCLYRSNRSGKQIPEPGDSLDNVSMSWFPSKQFGITVPDDFQIEKINYLYETTGEFVKEIRIFVSKK